MGIKQKLETEDLRKDRYFEYNGKEIQINPLLARTLQSMVYNIENDWDFVIIITGDRTVRVGKSVLAMQVCAYLSYCMKEMGVVDEEHYSTDDIYFESEPMIEEALNKPKFSINHYDEGRNALSTSKSMQSVQKDLLDFFAEAGQLNHVFVLVLPDYFTLKEEIAVPRSEFLINVYRRKNYVDRDVFNTGEKRKVWRLERGNFDVYLNRTKKRLYDLATTKRKKDYNLVKQDYKGKFAETYPVSEEEYRRVKKESLETFEDRHKDKKKRKKKLYKERKKLVEFAEAVKESDVSYSELNRLDDKKDHYYNNMVNNARNFVREYKGEFESDS